MPSPQRQAHVFKLRPSDEILAAALHLTAQRLAEDIEGARHDDEATLLSLRQSLVNLIVSVDRWIGTEPVASTGKARALRPRMGA